MHVLEVMTGEEAAAFRERIARLEFYDGRATARGAAKAGKQNTQSSPQTDPAAAALIDEVTDRLAGLDTFRNLAFPRAFVGLRFSRYAAGDHYGLHIDQALMGRPLHRHRTDLSFTLFLSDPDAYEGGALRLAAGAAAPPVRLPAGSLALYPTHLPHEVTTVTRGERIACVGWVESWIADRALREILVQLGAVKGLLDDEGVGLLPRLMFNEAFQSLLRYSAR